MSVKIFLFLFLVYLLFLFEFLFFKLKMLRLLMKDGYGQSIRERKVLKSVRPLSSRKNNKKNKKII